MLPFVCSTGDKIFKEFSTSLLSLLLKQYTGTLKQTLVSHLFVWDHRLPADRRLQNSSGMSTPCLHSQNRLCALRSQTNTTNCPHFTGHSWPHFSESKTQRQDVNKSLKLRLEFVEVSHRPLHSLLPDTMQIWSFLEHFCHLNFISSKRSGSVHYEQETQTLFFSKSCNIYKYMVPGRIEIQLINVLKHVGDEKL